MWLNELFQSMRSGMEKDMELAAVWLEKSVSNAGKRQMRIAPESLVRVENGNLVDGEPTHKVLGCWGNIANTSLGLTLISLETNEPSTLKLK